MKQICSTLIITVTFWGTLASANGIISYGGDEIKKDFYDTTKNIITHTKKIPKPLEPFPNFSENLSNTLNNLEIEIVEGEIYLNNQPVTAINYLDEKKIPHVTISQKRWTETIHYKTQMYRIVAHEMLPLIYIDDKTYVVSQIIENLIYYGYSTQTLVEDFSIYIPNYLKKWALASKDYYAKRTSYSILVDRLGLFGLFVSNQNNFNVNDYPYILEILKNYYKHIPKDLFCNNGSDADEFQQKYLDYLTSDSQLEQQIAPIYKQWIINTCGFKLKT